jgi:hypothetical protein
MADKGMPLMDHDLHTVAPAVLVGMAYEFDISRRNRDHAVASPLLSIPNGSENVPINSLGDGNGSDRRTIVKVRVWRRLDDRVTTSGQPTESQLVDVCALAG